MTILEEAQEILYNDRQDDYGDGIESTKRIAKLWSIVLDKEVTPEQVALCMIQVKISRQMNKYKRDNLIDGAGYFGLIERIS
jgi:hypothetical protein